MDEVCGMLAGWAQEVFLVDSYSQDQTVDVAIQHGVHVVQRRFRGFGDQWNFALRELPITAAWTLKLDPDERLTEKLKEEIAAAVRMAEYDAFELSIRLFFMGTPLPARLRLFRLWRTGTASFSNVSVNEHAVSAGRIGHLSGDVEHHDSPDLDHWLEKQNRYTTAEAISAFSGAQLADTPRLFGTPLQRRMWLKRYFFRVPFRYTLLFLYHFIWQGAWRAGWVGFVWSRLRCDVMRLIAYKRGEIALTGRTPLPRVYGAGKPDPRVQQYD